MIDTAAFQGKTAKFYTLGCKLNFSETSTFARTLYNMGVREAKKTEQADICLINTCSVTEVADHKCRQIIHRMVRQNPGAFVIVTGCYAQLESATVAKIEGVDLVLGSNEKADLVQYLSDAWNKVDTAKEETSEGEYHSVKTKDIKSFQASCSRGNRTRYFLKVQDGCNYFCTYCTIPFARGFSRNPTIQSLVAQAEEAAREGGKEIVLTGVNIGDFGKTTGESFLDLVKALDKVEGIQRFRISSLEPDLIDDELIAYCAESRAFMPHFHIPLQSGSDEVLELMHRRYDTALFARKIKLIKEKMPDAFIGVDVMVGSRGERPEYFEDCYNFLDSLPVTQLHVFPYSERPGTAALSIPYVVDDREKKHRAHKLLKLSDEKTRAFYAEHIGQEADVLFEKAARGKAMHGFTDNYIRVELSPDQAKEEYDNQILRVRLGEFNFDQSSLKAELL
ncbi:MULTISPECIES: tRNA (N(6)-L-threonylcarbamoyladenosine(37)-C(2))-methylthiotransferase MtaB [Prevotella]|jgi:MiaB-like protein|uniref:tRNA (N(6)-L-threonylcarbamoyladenosine(37)-C(2))-methylthiotransferase MtaB n=2 Tax=Prevotella melaninogenica TaxID=28132 RepID=A0ABX7XNJ6_9BACT|nr:MULTISPECIES: tRNA (N(6)-L-threonylcarbamoyladenosine(37)-C(2))-methylthiotransferase MtaB [Prevotella]MBF1431663.1 tRNA (N(6)-L-threonylcarbamoyladenosine(37)-C(2))-methylthiotransferase MtaB [Prevotella melaninogenica]MBF1578521.1 tRNA (N(6)-L-threonylcarbamoyladenosine(37)-C(2))-methylthiotransferase MtaB [Prevotella sp.]MBF1613922.1 tRNA (N(6)-L-threonylcarbamoyladenosine(37)-C(2))-methylthiotransferase MtaB [Prevotella sp.]MBF1616168.1 tRNA (N(6)-L-threonylcarbamoyladenosine(37)-C(2))-m